MMVPVKSEKLDWEIKDDEVVQLIIKRDKLIDRIVRKLFYTPNKTVIDLDKMGSLVWKHIDGNRNVYELSQIVKAEFGEKAEPLNERLFTYINILKNNNFIKLIEG